MFGVFSNAFLQHFRGHKKIRTNFFWYLSTHLTTWLKKIEYLFLRKLIRIENLKQPFLTPSKEAHLDA